MFKNDLSNHGKLEITTSSKIFTTLVCFFCVVLIITNMAGLKVFKAPLSGAALTTGIITYPLTFVLSDVVTEMYGKKHAAFMVYLGLALSLTMFGIIQLLVALPPHPYWVQLFHTYGYEQVYDLQKNFQSTFNSTGILIFASMLAYLTAQLTDVYVFEKLKKKTQGKHLWLRNNLSTILAQLLDTLIVSSFVFYIGFKMDFLSGLEIMGNMFMYKVAFSLLSTPFIYLLVYFLKKHQFQIITQ